jgi:hypothetical protein
MEPKDKHSSGSAEAAEEQGPSPARRPLNEPIDELILALQQLRDANGDRPLRRAVGKVTASYERLNVVLQQTVVRSESEVLDDADQDPAPDRLRAALSQAVVACLPNLKNRYVASLALGLVGDSDHVSLAAIARELGVSREGLRQRRVRAFQSIRALLPRRSAAATPTGTGRSRGSRRFGSGGCRKVSLSGR